MESELHDSRAVQLRRKHSERLRGLQIDRRVIELNDIESVEQLSAQGSAPPFAEHELARNRQVDIPARKTSQLTAGAARCINADQSRAKGTEHGIRTGNRFNPVPPLDGSPFVATLVGAVPATPDCTLLPNVFGLVRTAPPLLVLPEHAMAVAAERQFVETGSGIAL